MPRKHKNTTKHGPYVKPDYHSQNKQSNDDSLSNKKNKKNKLRTSYDIYKRLIHDPNIGINLNYINIGFEGTESIEEMPVLNWKMIDDGGDIPMHRINYFVLYLIDEQQIIIWDKKSKLDRLFCSGETNKKTQSLRALLSQINTSNIPQLAPRNDYKSNERDNRPYFNDETEGKDDEKKTETITNINTIQTQSQVRNTLLILDELLNIFSIDFQHKNKYKITLSCNKTRVIQEPQSRTKLSRNAYKVIASDTKTIMEKQCFIVPKTKQKINIQKMMEFSYANSEIYSETNEFIYIDIDKHKLRKYAEMEIEINHETTLDCAYRLQMYGECNIVMLNFSSAKNPGGGWDNGALAQEESIARSSTLIPTLKKYQSEFYYYHRTEKKTMLYSHALIYSPDIIIMKHGNGQQIKKLENGYYKCNIITSPAVNAKYYIQRAKRMDYMMRKYGKLSKDNNGIVSEDERKIGAWNVVEYVMRERCKRVLELAMKYNNECVILGAWGCGVFGNKPNMIAKIFIDLLKNRYYNVFRKVVFAILDDKKKKPLDKFICQFEKVFGRNMKNKSNDNY